MTIPNNNMSNTLCEIAMIPVQIVYFGWVLSSLGIPLLADAYINKLEQMKNPARLGTGCSALPWTMILGPFSIPISIYYAGVETFNYLSRSK